MYTLAEKKELGESLNKYKEKYKELKDLEGNFQPLAYLILPNVPTPPPPPLIRTNPFIRDPRVINCSLLMFHSRGKARFSR